METINWLLLDSKTISESDFKFWADDNIVITYNTNTTKHLYNQAEFRWKVTSDNYTIYEDTRWSCALFWTMWVISDLTWYLFTQADILEINRLAIDHYNLWVPWGMRMSKATDCVRTWWNNKFPKEQLTSYRLVIWDDKYNEALEKKHSLSVWYHTSVEMHNDSQDDWVLQWDTFPNDWGWHLVRLNKDWVKSIDDNYKSIKAFNTYEIQHIEKLKADRVYFNSAYLFLYTKTMEDKIRENIDLEWAQILYDKKRWNWLDPRWNSSRQEMMQVNYRQEEYFKLEIDKLKEEIRLLKEA